MKAGRTRKQINVQTCSVGQGDPSEPSKVNESLTTFSHVYYKKNKEHLVNISVFPTITHSYRRPLVIPWIAIIWLIAQTLSFALAENSCVTTFFQTFVVNHSRKFVEDEILSFQLIMEEFTDSIAGLDDGNKIMTTCTVLSQFIITPMDGMHSLNQIEYTLSWSSDTVDVSLYGEEFKDIISEDVDILATILQNGGLSVSEANRVFIIDQIIYESVVSPAPTGELPKGQTSEPTALPTFSEQVESEGFFLQNFTVNDSQSFGDDDIVSFENIMEGYTANFSDIGSVIESSCTFLFQRFSESENIILVGYSLSWTSMHYDVSLFSVGFETFMNRNFVWVAKRLRNSGLSVVDAGLVFRYDYGFPPSISPVQSNILPSTSPSRSLSFRPSIWSSNLQSTGPQSLSTFPSSHPSAIMSTIPNDTAPVQLVLTVISSSDPKQYLFRWIPCIVALAYIC